MSLNGKTVCFSGTLAGQTRAEAGSVASAAGASVSGSVTAKTDILIVSAISGSKKIIDAKAKGVEVWDQAKWDQVTKSAAKKKPAKRKAGAATSATAATKKPKTAAKTTAKSAAATPAVVGADLEMGTKFWKISLPKKKTARISYGTIGSAGRTTDKPFADAAAAAKYVTQQIAAKKKKGYGEKTAPGSPKKKAGLSGTALPTSVDSEHLEIDSGVATINQSVADDGMIEADDDSEAYAAQLALVDPATNSDKYYILQLIDCNGDKYVYRRNGRTGTRGQGQLNGPMELDAAVAEFEKLFKSKTGQSWTGRVPGQVPSSAKHYTYLKTNWLARNEEDEAKWMYHLTRDPLGKPDGWYAYDDKAGAEVEELYVSYAVDGNTSMSVRYVYAESNSFTYKVDLTSMTQTNTSSQKSRPIRRDTA